MASWRRSSDSLAVRGRLVTKQNRFGASDAASLAWQYSVSSCAVALAPGPQDDGGVDFLVVDRSGTPKDMVSKALERQNAALARAALAQAEPVPLR
jgi:hypothetical protein